MAAIASDRRKQSTHKSNPTALERTPAGASLIDVLDRVLDKGIVIDAWLRLSVVGINLITVEARVLVASIETYLKHSDSVASIPAASWHPVGQ